MPIEVVQSFEASAADVIAACKTVAEAHRWKLFAERAATGGLTFKTTASWAAFFGYHLDVSVQPLGRFVLMTVWTQSAGLGSVDLTREGPRLARQFTSEVVQALEQE